MNRTSKIGLSVTVVALMVAIVSAGRFRFPTWNPLAVPMPLSPGGARHDTFRVRTPQHYSLELDGREVGQFKEAWKDFLNSKTHPTIDCDITLRLLHEGREIYSNRLHSLTPGAWSSGTASWLIDTVEVPWAGRYELEIVNYTDLSYLQPTSPTIQLRLRTKLYKHAEIWCYQGVFGGALGCLIGLVLFVKGFFTKSPAQRGSHPGWWHPTRLKVGDGQGRLGAGGE